MKNLPSILAAGALLIVLLLYMCTYQVRSTEVAVRKTFGKADSVITEPGLKFKWPWPVQSAVKYDKRLRLRTEKLEETRTADSKNIILTTYTVWTIADPAKFHQSYPNEAEGERALSTNIRSSMLAVIGKHALSEFVSTEASERKLQSIEEEMREAVASQARQRFGIDIRSFGVKQLGLPDEVTKAVFMSMAKSQESKAKTYQAEGEAKAQEIVASAYATQQRILASAKRKVDSILAEADREVGQIYEEFKGHERLRIYLDKIEAIEKFLQNRTTLFLTPDWEPFDIFNEEGRAKATQAADAGEESATDPIPNSMLEQ